MEQISKEQRWANIISRVAESDVSFEDLGIDIQNDPFIEVVNSCEDYIVDSHEHTEIYCAIQSVGRSQHVEYNDGRGYTFELDGEIVNYQALKGFAGERIKYAYIVDSLGNPIALYAVA